MVLNCLAGEYTDASLRLLAPGGRFVEIGKTDLRDPAEVARAHPGVRYQAYNLMDLPPDRAGLLLREVLALFECGALTPPPVTAWDLRSAPGAFAHMRHARHEIVIFQIWDRSELEFDFRSWTRFDCLEVDGKKYLVDPNHLRAAYLENLEKFRAELKQGCHRHRIDLVPMVTDQPYAEALAQYLTLRMRR